MGRSAANIVVCNDLAIKRIIAEANGQPRKEWRVEKVAGKQRNAMPGFVLVTQPTGTGTFYLFYRDQRGSMKKSRLGDYASVGLAGAVKLWEDQTLAVAGGSDPVGNKHAIRTAMTFRELAQAFFASGSLASTTKDNYERQANTHIYDVLGDKPAETVSEQDILAICRRVEAKGNFALSNVIKSIVGGVYRYGRRQGLSSANPCLGIGRRGKKIARDKCPSSDEIKALWQAIDASAQKTSKEDGEERTATLSESMQLILKLAIVTGQRRTEVCGARKSELIDLKGDNARWVIPGDVNKRGTITEGRTKNGREQIVPLSPLAVSLFKEALANCADGEFVFPADLSKVKLGRTEARAPHIHGESVSKAMRRVRAVAKVEDVSIHDMRRAISNYLKDNGVTREVRDLVLNHLDGSVDGEHYSQNARMTKQVRAALELWARHIEEVVSGSKRGSSNVVSIKAAV